MHPDISSDFNFAKIVSKIGYFATANQSTEFKRLIATFTI